MDHASLEGFLNVDLEGFENPSALLDFLTNTTPAIYGDPATNQHTSSAPTVDFFSSFPILSSYASVSSSSSSSSSSSPTAYLPPSDPSSPLYADTSTPSSDLKRSTPSPCVIDSDKEKEEEEKRAQQRTKQAQASQEYRKRRRKKLEELERTVSNLTNQLESAKKEILKLQSTDLIGGQSKMKEVIEEEKRIIQLIEAASQESNVNEYSAQHLLSMFWSSVEIRTTFGLVELNKMINPVMMLKFSIFGIEICRGDTPFAQLMPAAPWWDEFCAQNGLNKDQIESINNIKDTMLRSGEEIFQERLKLYANIKRILFVLDQLANTHRIFVLKESDLSSMSSPSIFGNPAVLVADLNHKFDLLKMNYDTQLKLVLSAHRQICTRLTTRQHLMLISHAHGGRTRLAGAQEARGIWEMIFSKFLHR